MHVPKYHNKMEKIYSRNRIRLPKFEFYNNGNIHKNNKMPKKQKVLFKVIAILLVEIIVAYSVIKAIDPIVKRQCSNKAKSIATIISNEQATIVMENYRYEDLAVVIKDDAGKIQMVKLNIIPVNEIISDVAIKIQQELNNVDNASFGIRLGSFTGI